MTAPATTPLKHTPGYGDRTDFEPLTGAECRDLLGPAGLGRLGVSRGGFPLIIPVDYAVHGDRIIVVTDAQGFAMEVVPGADGPYDEIAAVSIDPWACGTCDRTLSSRR